ncbi:MAG TPA: four helix bundle protein [Candidatus Saccharimonadales bacterium]|jgi:four helix bundle protein
MPTTPSYKDMPIWQRSMQLAVDIYQLTSQLPATERLGLGATLQQAAVSIPTTIASGTKGGRSGFRAACLSGRQACAEVETLLLIIQQIYQTISVDDLLAETNDIQTALAGMAKRLEHAASSKAV